MSLVIRLRPQGSKNRQTYRLVVMEKRSPRNGPYLEMLGWYDPLAAEEKQYEVKAERVQFWLTHGAQISEKALSVVTHVSPEAKQMIHARKMAKLSKRREKVQKVKKKAVAPKKKAKAATK